jgi:hypothetical protein
MVNCPNCGTSVPEPVSSNQYCPNCGALLIAPNPSSRAPYFSPAPSGWTPLGSTPIRGPRPTGISVLAVLSVLDGVGWLILGAVFIYIGSVIAVSILDGIGAFAVLVGLVFFGSSYGLWTGKHWAWIILLIVTVIALIFAVVSAVTGLGLAYVIIGLIIDLVILYYLTRPNVRAFFGKGAMRFTRPT